MLGGVAFNLGKQTRVRRMQGLKILSLFALNDCVDTCFHLDGFSLNWDDKASYRTPSGNGLRYRTGRGSAPRYRTGSGSDRDKDASRANGFVIPLATARGSVSQSN